MKLIEDKASAWQTFMVADTPYGIEKIDSRCFYIFRLWGRERKYIRDREDFRREVNFSSKAKAIAYLEPIVAQYQENIVVSA